MEKLGVASVVFLGGCMLSTTATTRGLGTTGTRGHDRGGDLAVPNVFGMSRGEAIAALRRAGHRGSVSDDSSLCGSVVEGRVMEIGQVCYQHPPPGRVQPATLPIMLRVQTENPWQGNVGKHHEWRLMPNVVGMMLDQARVELRRAGFANEQRLRIQMIDEPGCRTLTVCSTYPEPMSRAGVHNERILSVARDPNAKPAEPDRAKTDAATTNADAKPFF